MLDSAPKRVQRGRSESQWLELFSEQAGSGLTQRAFCESRGIGYSTYDKAKRRYQGGRRSAVSKTKDFVSLTSERATTTEHWEVELSVGSGVVIRIRGR